MNKLRKLRKLRKAKRAANGGLDVDEDLDDEHNWLGDESFTVQMGEHAYLSEEKADDHDLKFFGTVALDSCSGVLIVGDNGYTVAHLDPIGAADEAQTTPDQNSLQEFRANVASMVEADYNSNRDNLGNAVMYIMTPSDGLGEEGELTAAAQRMGIRISINKYDVVGEDGMDDDYYEKQRGTLYVNISDRDSPKVKANGDDPAPAA